jgi:alpha-tubulin suppressor-like RCC1 family protein
MGLIILISLGVIVGVGTTVYLVTKPKPQKIDLFDHYKQIKRALVEYKKKNILPCENMKVLRPYLGESVLSHIKEYEIASDEKFLVVKGGKKYDTAAIMEKIGGKSYVDGDDLYLSFLQFKLSEVEPVAVITMFPKDNLTTTSTITWQFDQSICEAGEIKEAEWRNMQERYSESGDYSVDLRIMDRNENWSEWVGVTFHISEEKGYKGISAGADFIFKIKNSGRLEAYGKNKYGQIGDGTLNDFNKLNRVTGHENVAQIACGDNFTLYKKYDGSLYSVGSNEHGQLGVGTKIHNKNPQKIWGIEGLRSIAAGNESCAAVLASGAVLTWGNNDFGQLGEDKPQIREIPKRVKGVSKVKQIDVGANHMAAVLYDGTVMCWGDNGHGQIGMGFKGKMIEPTLSNMSGAFYVAAGRNFTVAALENGKVMGWGHNHVGQLGMISETDVVFPREIPKLKSVVKVVARDSFVLALTDIGEVYTWGKYNLSDTDFIATPTKIEGLKFIKDIDAQNNRAFAMTEDGRVLTWGSNIDQREYLEEINSSGH